jgi:hypothetical protein
VVDDVTFTKQGKPLVSNPANSLSNRLTWMLTKAQLIGSHELGPYRPDRDGALYRNERDLLR